MERIGVLTVSLWVMISLCGAAHAQRPMLLKDINRAPSGGVYFYAASTHTHLFFTADDGYHGKELWRTDGTFEGTALVTDLSPLSISSIPINLTAIGTTVVFTARVDGNSGLYYSKGADGRLDFQEGFKPSDDPIIVASESVAYVNGFRDGMTGLFRWTPGIETADMELVRAADGEVLIPRSRVRILQDKAEFLIEDRHPQGQPWVCQLPVGEVIAERVLKLPALPQEFLFVAHEGLAFYTTGPGQDLWQTDGTEEGTSKVVGAPGSPLIGPVHALVPRDDNTFYFSSFSDLWIAGKSSKRARAIKGPTLEREYPSPVEPLVTVGNIHYFLAGRGGEIWQTLGSDESTRKVHGVSSH